MRKCPKCGMRMTNVSDDQWYHVTGSIQCLTRQLEQTQAELATHKDIMNKALVALADVINVARIYVPNIFSDEWFKENIEMSQDEGDKDNG